MSERLRSLQRIRAVQQSMRDLTEWKLAAAERAKADVVDARAALEAFVAEERPTGAFAAVATRTLARQAARAAEAEQARLEAAGGHRQAEGRLKLAEKLVDTLDSEEHDKAERRRLEELTQALLAAAAQRTQG